MWGGEERGEEGEEEMIGKRERDRQTDREVEGGGGRGSKEECREKKR